MGFITPEGLENLTKYKYVSGGYTYLDKVMNHWWEFFITLLPMVNSSSRLYIPLDYCTKPHNSYRANHYSNWILVVYSLRHNLDCQFPIMVVLLLSNLCIYVSNTRCSGWKAGKEDWYIFSVRAAI